MTTSARKQFFRHDVEGELHPTYAFHLNEPEPFFRNRLEEMWSTYEPYCPDPTFLSDAPLHFNERTWEMYLACLLMDHGFPLRRPPSDGPDICIDVTPRIWIEATAVSAGSGADRVIDRRDRLLTPPAPEYTGEDSSATWHRRIPSEESLILRCTSAVTAKVHSHSTDVAAGIVQDQDAYIIALSLANIDDAFYGFNYDGDWPIPLQALFGIGEERLSPAHSGQERSTLFRTHRPVVTKLAGKAVNTTGFSWPSWPQISGVFGTALDVRNMSRDGREVMFVNNPHAAVPVATGTFAFGMEYVASDGTIRRNDHRTRLTYPRFGLP